MQQTNPYLKQFPELMKGKKILYVHGFGSSGQSGTVTRIREVLPSATVIAPDLPLAPQEALTLLYNICEQEKPDLIIGTSMGGMYTEMLRGYDRILVNPALRMGDTMKEHGMIGAQHFSNPSSEDEQRVWGLFGDEDTTVNTYDLFHEHYPTAIRFHGEHRMNDHSFMHAVVPVIRWIDDRQEQRERPVIYIDLSTLRDPYGKPVSSAQKTVRTLLETYQLYFVASAPTETEHYRDINQWLFEYITVPAWGHTIFTSQKELLYGDYLIDTTKTEAMGTLIQFGTDTFKTWDDIATFFERLGGQ